MNLFGLMMLPAMGICALMAALDGYGVFAAVVLIVFAVASVNKASR
jgi:hypothetical protein